MDKKRTDIIHEDVFISWTSADRELKNKAYEYLSENKLSTKESDEGCSGDYRQWSKEAVGACSIFLLILTQNTLKSTYVPQEIEALKMLDDWENRCVVICESKELYNSDPWDLNKSESAVFIDEDSQLTDEHLRLAKNKIISLLIHRQYKIYCQKCESKYLRLIPFFDTKTSTKEFAHKDIYIPRSITEFDENGQELGKFTSPKKLISDDGIIFISGEAGSGKTQYIHQIREAAENDAVVISLSCSKVSKEEKDLLELAFEEFHKVSGGREFYSMPNFNHLLYVKHLVLVLDGMDEIATSDETIKFIKKVEEYYKANSENSTIVFTSRNPKSASAISLDGKKPRTFVLDKFGDEDRRNLIHNLFLKFEKENETEPFYVKVSDLSEEIKTNPLLISQLAMIYNKNPENLPQTIVGIYDAVIKIISNVEAIAEIDIPKNYTQMVSKELSRHLKSFSKEMYSRASKGENVEAVKIFKKILNEEYRAEKEERAEFLVEYLENRSILVEGEFYHKMFLEYFTAVKYYEDIFDDYEEIEKEELGELFSNYDNPYWTAVIKMFLIKADSLIDRDTTTNLYSQIIEKSSILEYTILFDTCRDLIKHKTEAQYVLVYDILKKSAEGVYPAYGPLFWYIPQYGLYQTALRAATNMKGNVKTLALVRDVCAIFGRIFTVNDFEKEKCVDSAQSETGKSIDDKISKSKPESEEDTNFKIDGKALFESVEEKLSGVRRILLEYFCLGYTSATADNITHKEISDNIPDIANPLWENGNNNAFCEASVGCEFYKLAENIYPRCFNIREVKSLHKYNYGVADRMLTPFKDELGLYSHEDFPSLNGEYIGFISCPNNKEKAEETLQQLPTDKVKGVAFSSTENDFFEYIAFNRTSVKIMYIPENTQTMDNYFDAFLDLDMSLKGYCWDKDSKINHVETIVYIYNNVSSFIVSREIIEKTKFKNYGGGYTNHFLFFGLEYTNHFLFFDYKTHFSVSFENDVEEIPHYWFEGCENLTSIEFPNSLKSIGEGAFSGCSSLSQINLPDSIESIGKSAFRWCERLEKIKLPDSLQSIGSRAFLGCLSLLEINLPDSIESIGESAFWWCESLEKIKLPDSIESIESRAFEDCSSLLEINLPDSLQSIGSSAFEGCSSLLEINLPDSIESIESRAFECCSSLLEINLPDSIESIGESAFRYCKSLEKINLPDSLQSIGNGAFYGCSSLLEINLPDSIQSIGSSAFKDCSSLSEIEFYDGISQIGDCIFNSYQKIKKIKVKSQNNNSNSKQTRFKNIFKIISFLHIEEIFLPQYFEDFSNEIKGITSANFFCTETGKPFKFLPNEEEKEVFIKEGKTEISQEEFAYSNVETIHIPSSVEIIREKAFSKCRNLEKVIIEFGLKSIKNHSFEDCSSLLEINLPDSIKSIGKWAFYGCSSLSEINLPDSIKSIGEGAFSGCSSLSEINLPDSLESIGNEAFYGCSSLLEINLPDSIESIGGWAFKGCLRLSKIKFPAFIEYIGENAFKSCLSLTEINLPDSIESIGESAFRWCKSLKKINLPDSLESIGNEAFSCCSSLSEIKLPNSMKAIEHGMFSGCSNLFKISFSDSIKHIGYGAFSGCSNLSKINLPDSINSIGSGAFKGCSRLSEIKLSNSLESIGESAFEGCSRLLEINLPDSIKSIEPSTFKGCSRLSEIKLSDSINSIGSGAFEDCSSLLEINLPDSIKSIEPSTFKGCSSLLEINLPDSIESIGESAFWCCYSLEKINLPDSIESIGESAFWCCESLEEVIIPSEITVIKEHTFSSCTNLKKVILPYGLKEIGKYALEYCSALTEIEIPMSVRSIGNKAFKGCGSLKKVIISKNFKNDIGRIFGEIDPDIITWL